MDRYAHFCLPNDPEPLLSGEVDTADVLQLESSLHPPHGPVWPEPGRRYHVEITLPVSAEQEPDPILIEEAARMGPEPTAPPPQPPPNPWEFQQHGMVLGAVAAVCDRLVDSSTPAEEWHPLFRALRAREWVEWAPGIATKLDPFDEPEPPSLASQYRGHEWDLSLPDPERAAAVAAWQAGETEYVKVQAPHFGRELNRRGGAMLAALASTRGQLAVRDALFVEAIVRPLLRARRGRRLAASYAVAIDAEPADAEPAGVVPALAAELLGAILPAAARQAPRTPMAYVRVALANAMRRAIRRYSRAIRRDWRVSPADEPRKEMRKETPHQAAKGTTPKPPNPLDAAAELAAADDLCEAAEFQDRLALSPREFDVGDLWTQGMTIAETARRLDIRESAVEAARRTIKDKARRLRAM